MVSPLLRYRKRGRPTSSPMKLKSNSSLSSFSCSKSTQKPKIKQMKIQLSKENNKNSDILLKSLKDQIEEKNKKITKLEKRLFKMNTKMMGLREQLDSQTQALKNFTKNGNNLRKRKKNLMNSEEHNWEIEQKNLHLHIDSMKATILSLRYQLKQSQKTTQQFRMKYIEAKTQLTYCSARITQQPLSISQPIDLILYHPQKERLRRKLGYEEEDKKPSIEEKQEDQLSQTSEQIDYEQYVSQTQQQSQGQVNAKKKQSSYNLLSEYIAEEDQEDENVD